MKSCVDAIIDSKVTGIMDYSPCLTKTIKKVECWPVQTEAGSISVPSSILVGKELDFLSKKFNTTVEITSRGFSPSR